MEAAIGDPLSAMVHAASVARLRYRIQRISVSTFEVQPVGLRQVLFTGSRLACEEFVQRAVQTAALRSLIADLPAPVVAVLEGAHSDHRSGFLAGLSALVTE